MDDVVGIMGAIGVVLLVIKSMARSYVDSRDERRRTNSDGSIRMYTRPRRKGSFDDDYDDDEEEYDPDDDYEIRERERVLSNELRSLRKQMKHRM